MSEANTPSAGSKRKIAVLGGGLAGLTAAYEIDRHSDDVEITIYQMGWRLGGKLASSHNRAHGMRIEEHGIHVLFGAYENAFHVLRSAYDELGLTWQDAFEERNNFTLMEDVKGRWVRWDLGLPREDDDPGDVLADSGSDYCKEAPRLTADLMGWVRERILEHFSGSRVQFLVSWFFGRGLKRTCDRAQHIHQCQESGQDVARDEKRLLWRLRWNMLLIRVVAGIGRLAWTLLRPFIGNALQRVDGLRRLWIMGEFGIAVAAGLTRAALERKTRMELDELDLTQWLKRNGVLGAGISRTTANCAPLRMVYEVVFAYEEGDPSRRSLAAGTAIRDLLRLLFDRRGSLAYAMRKGSSETVITPLYQTLKRRPNVHFKFFHRIDELGLSEDESTVDRIHLTRQAEPLGDRYDPLIGDGAWPEAPLYDQLERGRDLEEAGGNFESPSYQPETATPGTLVRRNGFEGDFDEVVLAIPVDALRSICRPLANANANWRRMFETSHTTPTQSAQLWFRGTAEDQGFPPNEAGGAAMLGGYAQPLGNWVDLSITLANEAWDPAEFDPPRSVAYLCGPLDQRSASLMDAKTSRDRVRDTCWEWVCRAGPLLWPNAFGAFGFDWNRLAARRDAVGAERFEQQFFRANLTPSDRYTLTLPGTTRHRLAPHASGFEGLILAGDWTANGFDVGAVEATVMSGRLAARALLGLPREALPVYGEVRLPSDSA